MMNNYYNKLNKYYLLMDNNLMEYSNHNMSMTKEDDKTRYYNKLLNDFGKNTMKNDQMLKVLTNHDCAHMSYGMVNSLNS